MTPSIEPRPKRTRPGSRLRRGVLAGGAAGLLGWVGLPANAQQVLGPVLRLPTGTRLLPVQATVPATPAPQAAPPQPPAGPGPRLLPVPQPIAPPGAGVVPFPTGPLGTTPKPSAETLKEFGQFVEQTIDPANTLDLILNRPRLLLLKQAPKRILIPDEATVAQTLVTERQLSLVGKQVGSTVMTLWFADPADPAKDKVLSYLVRVVPDPEQRERLESAYKALEAEVNRAFPDSRVSLALVGTKVVVAGQAKDAEEGTQILRLVQANAPGQAAPPAIGQVNLNVTVPPGEAGDADQAGPQPLPPLQDFLSAGGPNVINRLAIPGEQQVMLKVVVAEVNRAAARSAGLNFNITNNQGITVFGNLTGSANGALGLGTGGGTGGVGGGSGAGSVGGAVGVISGANIPISLDAGRVALALTALQSRNYARSLAEPHLVTLNGMPASFRAGGEFPVPVTTGFTAGGLQGVAFVPFGVQLRFVPYVTDRTRIRLTVAATVSTRDNQTAQTNIGGASVPSLSTRNFNTTVELREGQTLAVAGLIQNNLGTQSARVPFLGDIPYLGRAFGQDGTSAAEQELVVLITPELVHPLDCKEVPPLPGADLFEPSDLEFFLEGRLESRRPYDYRSPVRNDWERRARYHRCEDVFILGPKGYSDCRTPAAVAAPAGPTPVVPAKAAAVAPPGAGK